MWTKNYAGWYTANGNVFITIGSGFYNLFRVRNGNSELVGSFGTLTEAKKAVENRPAYFGLVTKS